MIHWSIDAKGRTAAVPSLRERPRHLGWNLEIEHHAAPAPGEGRSTVGDHLCAFGYLCQCVRRENRVDAVWKVELDRVGLHEADIAPAVPLYPISGLVEHRVGQIDTHDPALGADQLLDEREVQAGAACDVDHGVTGAKPKCLYDTQAL